MKRLVAVIPVIVAAFVLAGCNSGDQTSPPPTTGSGGGSGSPSSSSSNSASGTANVKPCSLLTSSDLSQNQLTKAGSTSDNGARSCKWSNTTADGGDGYVISANIRDHQGVNSVNTEGYTVTADPIGDHQAKQLASPQDQSCIVAVGVGDSSRVDVQANGPSTTQESCQLANQFAKLIAANLPSS